MKLISIIFSNARKKWGVFFKRYAYSIISFYEYFFHKARYVVLIYYFYEKVFVEFSVFEHARLNDYSRIILPTGKCFSLQERRGRK